MGTTLDVVAAPRVLRTAAEHETALAEVERLLCLDPAPDAAEADRLELLGMLVSAYEDQHYPMGATTTPQSAVLFRIEQLGLLRVDLEPIMGGKSRVSEFLTGRRPLSMTQVIRLRDALGIPADLLIPKALRPRRAVTKGRPTRPAATRTQKTAAKVSRGTAGRAAAAGKKSPRREAGVTGAGA